VTTVGVASDDVYVHHIVVPGYPNLARMAFLQGSVRVEVIIGEDGRVLSAKGSGASNLLVRASEENVRQWVFCVGSAKNHMALKRTAIYVYRLEGKEQNYELMPRVVLDLPWHIEITAHPPEPQP